MSIELVAKSLAATALQGDISFADVYEAANEAVPIGEVSQPGDQTIFVIRRLLADGIFPVNSPFETPAGEPWPRHGDEAAIQEIERRLADLNDEPGFMDVCWFRHPDR